MKKKHTKGPWNVTKLKFVCYVPRNLRSGLGTSLIVPAPNASTDPVWIAEVTGDTPEEEEANARLIAAAPNLLEALQNTIRTLENAKALLGVYDRDKFKKDRIWIDKVLNRAKSILWEAIPVPEGEQ